MNIAKDIVEQANDIKVTSPVEFLVFVGQADKFLDTATVDISVIDSGTKKAKYSGLKLKELSEFAAHEMGVMKDKASEASYYYLQIGKDGALNLNATKYLSVNVNGAFTDASGKKFDVEGLEDSEITDEMVSFKECTVNVGSQSHDFPIQGEEVLILPVDAALTQVELTFSNGKTSIKNTSQLIAEMYEKNGLVCIGATNIVGYSLIYSIDLTSVTNVKIVTDKSGYAFQMVDSEII